MRRTAKPKRKLRGADLVQTWVFGFQQHSHASLEQLASVAAVRAVSVSDTAVHDRFTEQSAQLLHRVLEELTEVVVQAAQPVPLKLLRRFRAVICEDSSIIPLPDELAEQWQGCGGKQAHTQAAVKVHTCWDLKRGRLWGPTLTSGRTSDRRGPFNEELPLVGSLSIRDIGYFSLPRIVERHAADGYTLTRLQAHTALFTATGEVLLLEAVLPRQVGQMREVEVQVGSR